MTRVNSCGRRRLAGPRVRERCGGGDMPQLMRRATSPCHPHRFDSPPDSAERPPQARKCVLDESRRLRSERDCAMDRERSLKRGVASLKDEKAKAEVRSRRISRRISRRDLIGEGALGPTSACHLSAHLGAGRAGRRSDRDGSRLVRRSCGRGPLLLPRRCRCGAPVPLCRVHVADAPSSFGRCGGAQGAGADQRGARRRGEGGEGGERGSDRAAGATHSVVHA